MTEQTPPTNLGPPSADSPVELPVRRARPGATLLTLFLLTLAAGAVAGFAAGGRTPSPHDGHTSGWISQHLNLTPDQRDRIHAIWTQAFGPSSQANDSHSERQKLDHERDQQVRQLLNPTQLQAYEALMARYDQQVEQLSRQRHERFAQAVEKTRQILTAEQRAEFDEFMKKRETDHGGWGSHGGDHEGAMTQPSGSSGTEKFDGMN